MAAAQLLNPSKFESKSLTARIHDFRRKREGPLTRKEKIRITNKERGVAIFNEQTKRRLLFLAISELAEPGYPFKRQKEEIGAIMRTPVAMLKWELLFPPYGWWRAMVYPFSHAERIIEPVSAKNLAKLGDDAIITFFTVPPAKIGFLRNKLWAGRAPRLFIEGKRKLSDEVIKGLRETIKKETILQRLKTMKNRLKGRPKENEVMARLEHDKAIAKKYGYGPIYF